MEGIAVFEVLRARILLIVALCLVAGLGGYACSYLLPERYDGSALVLVRPQEPIKLDARKSEKDIFDFPVSQSMAVETPSKTYIEIIKSAALVGEVVRALQLDKDTSNSLVE